MALVCWSGGCDSMLALHDAAKEGPCITHRTA